MQQEKSLTLDGLVLKNFGLLILSLGMIFVGIYLTNHFLIHSTPLESQIRLLYVN